MKKVLILLVISICWAHTLFSERIAVLPELMKPAMIAVYENELYVAEGSIFSIYSTEDFQLIRQFGKKGEGPGELIELPFFPNKVTVLPDQVFVTGIGKAISFSKQGIMQKEYKTHQGVIQLLPVGNNFVGKVEGSTEDGKTIIMKVELYNRDMKKIKELYRQKWLRQGDGSSIKLDMVFDFTSVAISGEQIFIEESPRGFLIEVFDSNGNKLYDIKKDYQGPPFTAKDRERIENMLKNDPGLKNEAKRNGGQNAYWKRISWVIPDSFPAIKGIEISGNKLYVRTFKTNGDKEEYLVMDLKGKLLKKVYIPKNLEISIKAQIAGAKLYSIWNEKMYYLKENEAEEEWELFVEDLAP